MLPVLFAMLLQQQPPTPAAPAMHVVVSPANPTVTAGDSLRLTAQVHDAAGRALPKATVRWFGGSFEGRVDSLGFVHGGSRGTVVVYAVPSVDGVPGKPTPIQVRVLATPAARIDVTPRRPSCSLVSASRWTPSYARPTVIFATTSSPGGPVHRTSPGFRATALSKRSHPAMRTSRLPLTKRAARSASR